MNPNNFLRTARRLATPTGPGRPLQSDLRRAASTTYYALFHCLAECVADSFVGKTPEARRTLAWREAYRGLEHGHVRRRLESGGFNKRFPRKVQNFAATFTTMQKIRQAADYDPDMRFRQNSVQRDIEAADKVITDFSSVSRRVLREFSVYVIMKHRGY